ncbi:MAG: hypothetical protein HS101_03910 [Planctomycetia bacterium]|nr:hypothetical protein [Planctomycetia bacterium]MCC7315988.1 hypothetical protein [Planctomycetota bacterium]
MKPIQVRPSILLLAVIMFHAIAAMCSFVTVVPANSSGDVISNAAFVGVLLLICVASLRTYVKRSRSQLPVVVVPACILVYLLLIGSFLRWLRVI